MTNNSIKVLVLGFIALLLTYFNKAYSILIMLVLILIYVVNAYQLEKHYQRMGRFMQRERDNELKEVEIENKYHEKILSQLIRSMNLPMLFVDKEGKIAFTNQSFRKGFEIPHLKGRYYKDIFVGEMLDLVEQCYVFERPLSTVVKIQSRYYQVESSPVFSDHEKLIFDGTIVLFTDVSKMKEIEDMQKQFLSDVSHELKTPMTSIIGYADLMRSHAKEKHLSLIYHNQIKEPLILDYSTIKMILSNFISNAIKYSNEGIITIKTKKADDTFILSVQDEGIGIPKNKLNYIYDRFYQVDKSRSSKISTGLGLSIVKKIVELNQGTIDVESSAGIGSTFTVKLPINPKVSHNDDII